MARLYRTIVESLECRELFNAQSARRHIKTPRHEGHGILKLSDGKPLDEEERRQNEAQSVSPALARRIPAVTHVHTAGPRSALLMIVAGHGLN
jgi:hypothetical protein